jgi:hypothetical protein
VFYKRAELDGLAFPPGEGTPFVESELSPLLTRPTSTKQWTTSESRLVVVAWDPQRRAYAHAVLDHGTSAPVPSFTQSPAPVARPDGGRIFIDRFDAGSADGGAPNWSVRDTDPRDSLAVVADPDERGRVARLVSRVAGERVRACREGFSSTGDSPISISARVLVTGRLADDAVIGMLRGGGREIVSVRLTRAGTFGYTTARGLVDTGIRFEAGAWYRSLIEVDRSRGTYRWRVERPRGRVLLNVSDASIPGPAALADAVCFQVPTSGGTALLFDDVEWRGT